MQKMVQEQINEVSVGRPISERGATLKQLFVAIRKRYEKSLGSASDKLTGALVLLVSGDKNWRP